MNTAENNSDESVKVTGNEAVTNRITMPVIEERVTIDKKVVETGTVRLSKRVHENVESFEVPLTSEEMHVERFQKNQIVDIVPPALRQEGDVTIISVLKEVAVVEKRMMLVEEIHVTKKQVQKNETVEVTVRKEEVYIDRI